jgi:hypothetical protein
MLFNLSHFIHCPICTRESLKDGFVSHLGQVCKPLILASAYDFLTVYPYNSFIPKLSFLNDPNKKQSHYLVIQVYKKHAGNYMQIQ